VCNRHLLSKDTEKLILELVQFIVITYNSIKVKYIFFFNSFV